MSAQSSDRAGPFAWFVRWRRARHAALMARRKLWLQVHLWLGLALGLFLSVFGLTGAVLVFHSEIDHALNPAFFTAAVPPNAQRASLERVRQVAQQQAPVGTESISLTVPKSADETYVAMYWAEPHTPAPEEAVSVNIAINAYTGDVVGRRVFYHAWNPLKHCLMGFFFKLHYALLLGEWGVMVVGAMAVLLVVSVFTGLILWWPLDGKWRRALTIKRGASAVRLNYDVHQVTGYWSLIVLLALLTSGLYFNLPEQFKWMVQVFSPLTPEPTATASRTHATLMPLDALLSETARLAPGGELNYIALPDAKTGLAQVCYRNVAALRPYILDNRCITVDATSAEVRLVSDASSGSAADTFMQWQWPLHSGQAFGWTGRILVFLCGLACPVFFVTGLVRWLQKRRATQRSKKTLP